MVPFRSCRGTTVQKRSDYDFASLTNTRITMLITIASIFLVGMTNPVQAACPNDIVGLSQNAS